MLQDLFLFSARQMSKRYPILITFINHLNPRSFTAHTKKVGLDVIKDFSFNGNKYYELGFETVKAHNEKNGRFSCINQIQKASQGAFLHHKLQKIT